MARQSFRQGLMLFTACGLVCARIPAVAAGEPTDAEVNLGVQLAQADLPAGPARAGGSDKASAAAASRSAIETITVKAQRRLLKEKNSPSAVTELGQAQIQATGISGSPATLLRQAPSIYVYQQGLGDNAPELTVRGLRGLEVATTLDGVPTQDLLAPGSFYLANNLGGVFTLGQIGGVHIYPGVAYPDKNTFGTIGGTIAYDTKRPTKDYYFDVSGSVGSFGTFSEGFELNSGALDSPLGTGDNAVRLLLNYKNLQTQGFIDGTPNRENEMEFAFDKPYNDGLSTFQATVIYNTASGLIENEPVPVPYLNKNGLFSNYPTNLDFAKQDNDFLTIILKDDTYINDNLSVGLTTFYLGNNNNLQTYSDVNNLVPGGNNGPLTVGASSPFINNQGGFGYGGYYGPPAGDPMGLGVYGVGYGGYYYNKQHSYNPFALYPIGSKQCPTSLTNQYNDAFGDPHFAPCGLNDETTGSHSDTYGLQPRATIILPDYYGVSNTIKIGGLFAKETQPAGYSYLGGDPNSPLDAAHSTSVRTGGFQRTIYQGYIQDKIDLLDDTLHLTPGLTVEGTFSSFTGSQVFRSRASPYYGPAGAGGPNGAVSGDGTADQNNLDRYGPYKATKWDREYLPFFNISYDFDKIAPALAGLRVYGSTGNSALFAPVGDFGPNTAGAPPFASIVHLYEGGVQYDTSKLLLAIDYYYQKVDRDFGYYSSQTGTDAGRSIYSADGQREFKGFEASAQYQVLPSLQLFGNVSHLLAKYLKTALAFDTVAQDQYGIALKGQNISGIPDWLSTFGVDWKGTDLLRDGDILEARLTGQYTGHQYTTYDLQGPVVYTIPGVKGIDYSDPSNVYDTFTGDTTTDPNGGISPFATFNLDLNYTLPTPQLPVMKKVTFDLNIQNLFDQHYFQYFYKQISPSSCQITASNPTGNPYGCTPQFADGIPGQPFSVFFTVTARF